MSIVYLRHSSRAPITWSVYVIITGKALTGCLLRPDARYFGQPPSDRQKKKTSILWVGGCAWMRISRLKNERLLAVYPIAFRGSSEVLWILPKNTRRFPNITKEHPKTSEYFRKFQKVTEDFRKSPESPLSKFSNFINVVTEFQIKTSDYFPLLSSVPSFIFNRNSS